MQNKLFLVFFASLSLSTSSALYWFMNSQNERLVKLQNSARINALIIEKFTEYCDEEILARVKSEVEFDWVVKDL